MAWIWCVTLWEPWATLMSILGPDELPWKCIETRSWKPLSGQLRPGDLLGIHASKSEDGLRECCREPIRSYLEAAGYRHEITRRGEERWNLPLGVVRTIVQYRDAWPTTHIRSSPFWRECEADLGNYAPGRYGWITRPVLRLEPPIPARGAQGLWTWQLPAEVEEMLKRGGHL